MADNAILFKYVAKSVGMKLGIVPSFMAKPWGNVRISVRIVNACTLNLSFVHSYPDAAGQ